MKFYGKLINHKLVIENQVQAKSKNLPLVEIEVAYNGELWEKGYAPEKPQPTKEEQRQAREKAYLFEVDPITAQIQRLKDEQPIPEEEIAKLLAKRTAKVAEIREKYAYPEEGLMKGD